MYGWVTCMVDGAMPIVHGLDNLIGAYLVEAHEAHGPDGGAKGHGKVP